MAPLLDPVRRRASRWPLCGGESCSQRRGRERVWTASRQGGRRPGGGRHGEQLRRLAAVDPRGARDGGRRRAGRDALARRAAPRAGDQACRQTQRTKADVIRLRRVGRPEEGAEAGVHGHRSVAVRRHGGIRGLRVGGRAGGAARELLRGGRDEAAHPAHPPSRLRRGVDSSTAVVLANALYFKGAWPEPFDVFNAPFHTPGGATVRVPAMTTGRSQYIALYPGFRALKLPYRNDGDRAAAFYMLILLPDSGALSLSALYDKVVSSPEFIRKHTPEEEVEVRRFMVPKFKFTSKFEASSDMRKLGVTRAFAGGDFSGMVSGGDGRLSIGEVYHKATIEVDEQGTVAAAATAIGMEGSALPSEPPHLVDFVADRPFLFAVVEERTGTTLFLGHVVNPLAK
ncbi:hypothetical protein VPH35_108398 [Triticum aestivum]